MTGICFGAYLAPRAELAPARKANTPPSGAMRITVRVAAGLDAFGAPDKLQIIYPHVADEEDSIDFHQIRGPYETHSINMVLLRENGKNVACTWDVAGILGSVFLSQGIDQVDSRPVEFELTRHNSTLRMAADFAFDFATINQWSLRSVEANVNHLFTPPPLPSTPPQQQDLPLDEDTYAGTAPPVADISGETVTDIPVSIAARLPTLCAQRNELTEPSDMHEDVILFQTHAGREKLEHLVNVIHRRQLFDLSDERKRVLVVGAHPGIATQALLSRGYDVHEVDTFPSAKHPQQYASRVHYTRCEVKANTPASSLIADEDMGKYCGVLCDIATSEEAAATDTHINFSVAERMRSALNVPVVIQARSLPMTNGSFFVLDSLGHELRGCETYWAQPPSRAVPPHVSKRWDPSTMALSVNVSGGANSKQHSFRFGTWSDISDQIMATAGMRGCTNRGGARVVHALAPEDWFQVVACRNFRSAAQLSNSSVGRRVLSDAASDFEVADTLVRRYGHGRSLQQLEAVFASRARGVARGVDPGVLERTPHSVLVLHSRHEQLMGQTARGHRARDGSVRTLMRHPMAGRLLSDLSALRTGPDPTELEEYSSLLALNHKAVLMSRVFHVLLLRFLRCNAVGSHSRLHSHELESLLYELSTYGTLEDKLAYMGMRIIAALTDPPTVRNYVRSEGRLSSLKSLWKEVLPTVLMARDTATAFKTLRTYFKTTSTRLWEERLPRAPTRPIHDPWRGSSPSRGSMASSVARRPSVQSFASSAPGTPIYETSYNWDLASQSAATSVVDDRGVALVLRNGHFFRVGDGSEERSGVQIAALVRDGRVLDAMSGPVSLPVAYSAWLLQCPSASLTLSSEAAPACWENDLFDPETIRVAVHSGPGMLEHLRDTQFMPPEEPPVEPPDLEMQDVVAASPGRQNMEMGGMEESMGLMPLELTPELSSGEFARSNTPSKRVRSRPSHRELKD